MKLSPTKAAWAILFGLFGLIGTAIVVRAALHLNACTVETLFGFLPIGAACGAMLGSAIGMLLSRRVTNVKLLAVLGALGFWPIFAGVSRIFAP